MAQGSAWLPADAAAPDVPGCDVWLEYVGPVDFRAYVGWVATAVRRDGAWTGCDGKPLESAEIAVTHWRHAALVKTRD